MIGPKNPDLEPFRGCFSVRALSAPLVTRPKALSPIWRKPRLKKEGDVWKCTMQVTCAITRRPVKFTGLGPNQDSAWFSMMECFKDRQVLP